MSPYVGFAVNRTAVAAGATSNANTSRLPVTWLVPAAANAEQQQERSADQPRRHSTGTSGVRVDGGEHQRPAKSGERHQRARHRR